MTTRTDVDWHLLAYGFLFMFWSSPGQTYLISLYSNEIRTEFALSHGEFGALYSLATLLSAGVLVWSGRLVDRVELMRLSLALVLLLALACWWMSAAGGVLSLLGALFLLRQIGQGLMSHTAVATMVRYFESARGRATAVAMVGFAVAEAVLPALTIAMITAVGWRMAWQYTATAIVLVMVPATWYSLRGHRQRHQRYLARLYGNGNDRSRPIQRQWSRGEVLRDHNFYIMLPVYLAPAFFFTGFFFHQVHLVAAKGWDLSWWGERFAVYAGAALLSTLLTGPLVDRVGATRLLPVFSLPLAAAFAILSLSSSTVTAVVFLVLTGITTGWAPTVMGPFWAERYGVQHLGSIKALGSTLVVFSSALSPFLLGWLIDRQVSIDTLALASAIYIIAASGFAALAFRR